MTMRNSTLLLALLASACAAPSRRAVTVRHATKHDLSGPLAATISEADQDFDEDAESRSAALAPPQSQPSAPIVVPVLTVPSGAKDVEQLAMGTRPGATLT